MVVPILLGALGKFSVSLAAVFLFTSTTPFIFIISFKDKHSTDRGRFVSIHEQRSINHTVHDYLTKASAFNKKTLLIRSIYRYQYVYKAQFQQQQQL